MQLSHRERVLRAINHQETDRVPIDFGSTPNTTIVRLAYENLKKYLGVALDDPLRFMVLSCQTVEVDEPILRLLDVDTRAVVGRSPSNSCKRVIADDIYVDEWGVTLKAARRADGALLYYDMISHPLADATTLGEIERFSGPEPEDKSFIDGLAEKAKSLREMDYALVGHSGDTGIFENCWYVRGMDNFLSDLLIEKKMAQAVLDKVFEIQSQKMARFLDAVGAYLDVVAVGDDLASQTAPLISPALYRQMIKPYHAKYFELIKKKTKAKLQVHSCGAVTPLLDDLIEIGVDIINPVQVSALGLEPRELKKRFGERVTFWGGIDTQHTLPKGSEAEVRAEVRRRIEELGVGGGYVLASVHNIQADVPPKNVVAMFDEAVRYERR